MSDRTSPLLSRSCYLLLRTARAKEREREGDVNGARCSTRLLPAIPLSAARAADGIKRHHANSMGVACAIAAHSRHPSSTLLSRSLSRFYFSRPRVAVSSSRSSSSRSSSSRSSSFPLPPDFVDVRSFASPSERVRAHERYNVVDVTCARSSSHCLRKQRAPRLIYDFKLGRAWEEARTEFVCNRSAREGGKRMVVVCTYNSTRVYALLVQHARAQIHSRARCTRDLTRLIQ